MVTTSGGTLRLRGQRSGTEYSYSVFVSDVVAEFWKFSTDSTAVAGSQNFLILPNEPCRIVDIALLATPTVSTASGIFTNDVSTGHVILVGNVLYTVQTRSFPAIVLGAGKKLTVKQF